MFWIAGCDILLLMRIFDTLSGKAEHLLKTERKVNMFVCGLTVYDNAHIGNARTYVFFDSAVKFLRSRGWDIFYLQNITDVDDKIIKRAAELRIPWNELAAKFTNIFLRDMRALGVSSVDEYAKATKFISQIVKQIKELMVKGYAYKIADGYYFDITKFKGYGKLSRRSAEQAEDSVSRIDESLGKRNKGDFCLWKFHRAGEPSWKTELGDGRPGWHIEDTAITENFFGPQYDIHGGGVDLKFPHHEAEIAQQEAASGKTPLVKVWMHTGLLFVNGEKMSKSLGNFVTIEDFLKKHSPIVFRLMVLMHHYRSNLNYTDSLLAQTQGALNTIQELLDKLQFVSKKKARRGSPDRKIAEMIKIAEHGFISAMEEDLNTPAALSAIFKFASALNGVIWNIKAGEATDSIKFIRNSLSSLGLGVGPMKIPFKILFMLSRRDKLRVNKQFIQSDILRKKVESLGYKVDDTPLGSFARKV